MVFLAKPSWRRPPNRRILWVLSLVASVGQFACARSDAGVSPSAMVSLVGTAWSLVQLDRQPVGVRPGAAAPTLLLADKRASGFAGCNRLAAAYDLTADRLTFNQIATTRMFCAEGMDLEQRYLAALESTRTYRLSGQDLELVGAAGVLARFQMP